MAYNPANPYDIFFSGQGRRSYNSAPDAKQFSFLQAFNPNYVNGAISGQFQPLTTDDQGALRVNIGTGINISANITGVTVNVPPSTAVTGVVNVTGQVAITNPVVAVTGTVNPTAWQKVASSGYVGSFSPLGGAALVNKINGVSKANASSSFILVYDGVTGAGNFPVASVATQPGNNWFVDLAEAGVQFNSALTIVNSTDAIEPVNSGPADFFASVIYRQ